MYLMLVLLLFSCAGYSGPPKMPPQEPKPAMPNGLDEDQREYLAAHNALRKKKGVPPLKYDLKLEAFAKKWSEHLASTVGGCRLQHSQAPHQGENLAMYYGARNLSPMEVFNMWAREEKDFDYATNSCTAGEVCGHYTQLVWSTTKRVGCSWAICLDPGKWKQKTIYTCSYHPPGNIRGHKPY